MPLLSYHSASLTLDPLVQYTWDLDALGDKKYDYQIFRDRPIAVNATPASAFGSLETLTTSQPHVVVSAPGSFRAEFKQEAACWIEFDSPDLEDSGFTAAISISENSLLAKLETTAPVAHKNTTSGLVTYRMESNSELYEGIQYAWVHVTPVSEDAETKPWHITGFRRVCQVVPTNYKGFFQTSDSDLNKVNPTLFL